MKIFPQINFVAKRYYRTVIGSAILLVAFIAAILIAHEANRTVLLWGTANELAAGAVISESDLVPIRALLPENSQSYFSTTAVLSGAVVTNKIGAGELIATTSLMASGSQIDSRYVPLEVSVHDLPNGIARGEIVDIYAVAKNSTPTQELDSARLVAAATTVIEVDRKGDLSGSVGVVVNLRSQNVIPLLSQLNSHRILIVQHV